MYSCKWNYRHDHCIYMDYVCVFRATVCVFMQVELQTRPLYIHGLCVCLQSNCMCIHASGTTDTTTVYTWTMCVSSEQLYVYSCKWNYRHDHCIYMDYVCLQSNCMCIHASGTIDTTTVYTWTMCVFRATVCVFMQVELQTRPLYIHGLCVCLLSNCMCIYASGTIDTTTVYTWTMCVSSEQLYVYLCKWNYRHDHCIYMDYVCVFRATVCVFMQVEL